MTEGLLVGLVLAVLWFLEKMLGTPMVIRPIVTSTLVGLVLGDVTSGIIMGAALELIFMGAIQIGGSVPPDVLVGAGLGTGFAIITGQGAEMAITLGLPISIIAQSLKVIVFIVRSWFMRFAVSLAEDANIKGMIALNVGGLILQCFMYFAVAFAAITFGSSAVESFINAIPDFIMEGLRVAGGLLPAVGFALLLQPMLNRRNFLYLLIGFILVTYLQLPMVAVTILGVFLAFLVVFELAPSTVSVPASASDQELEDLFDE